MATHLEFYVQIFADLFTHRYDIKRIEHLLQTVKTIDKLRSLNKVFIKRLNYIKATRNYMELKNQNIQNDYQRNLHFASKDSRKSFKFLQKLEEEIIPLRRIFKTLLAVNETGLAYQKIHRQRQNATYKKFNDKITLIYKKWEKYPELCSVFDKLVKKLSRKSDELNRFTEKLFFDLALLNSGRIRKLSHLYKNIIAESLQRETAMIAFCLFQMKLAAKQFKISSKSDRQVYSKINTGEAENRINMKTDTNGKNEFGYREIMVIFKCSRSIAILESKIVAKCIEANWKSRKKKRNVLNFILHKKIYFTNK